MIAEALLYAASTPFTEPAHRAHIRSSVSLWARGRRCRKAWAEHEENTRKAIIAVASKLTRRRTAVVLGSGLLRDIPIDILAKAFDTVVLVDLVHLANVRMGMKRRRYSNVVFVERDVSGFEDSASINPEPLRFLLQVPYLDFVVSANMLSQLGRGVARRAKDAGVAAPDELARHAITAHLEGLRHLPCPTCVVTDIGYSIIDRNGKIHEEHDLMLGVKLPPARAQWHWPVAPLGEESRDYQIVHKVVTI